MAHYAKCCNENVANSKINVEVYKRQDKQFKDSPFIPFFTKLFAKNSMNLTIIFIKHTGKNFV